jgi:hypothetical protein
MKLEQKPSGDSTAQIVHDGHATRWPSLCLGKQHAVGNPQHATSQVHVKEEVEFSLPPLLQRAGRSE